MFLQKNGNICTIFILPSINQPINIFTHASFQLNRSIYLPIHINPFHSLFVYLFATQCNSVYSSIFVLRHLSIHSLKRIFITINHPSIHPFTYLSVPSKNYIHSLICPSSSALNQSIHPYTYLLLYILIMENSFFHSNH